MGGVRAGVARAGVALLGVALAGGWLGGCADAQPTAPEPDAEVRDRGVGDASLLDMQAPDAARDGGVDAHLDLAVDAADPADLPIDAQVRDMPPIGDVLIVDPEPDAAVPMPCADAIDLNAAMAAEGHFDGDTRARMGQTLGSCGGAAGGELLFRYVVGPDEAEVVFATDYPQTTAATVLYLRTACDDDADLACVRGTDEAPGTRLVYRPAGPEVVYLLVDTGSRDGGGPFRLTAGPPPRPACDDGIDNDGDGRLDLADPGCVAPEDDSEGDPLEPPTCADGLDNDEDGLVDYPADPDCTAAGDDGERGGCIPEEPCDGRNLGPDFQDNSTTGGPWMAFRWTTGQASEVTGLELFTGEAAGPTALSLHTSVNNLPGERLGRAPFVLDAANAWQGGLFDAPAVVEANTDYWIVWEVIGGAQSPFTDGGMAVDYRGSFDQGRTWNGPFQTGVKFRVYCCGR